MVKKIKSKRKTHYKKLAFEDYVCSQIDYNVCEHVFLREQKKWQKHGFIDV